MMVDLVKSGYCEGSTCTKVSGGMFLDMTFWPEICFCPHCRKRWFDETGLELPRTIDWNDENFRRYAYARDVWMADYAKFATAASASSPA